MDDVTHVINYECPEDDKAYLHRTGRTGRAGRDGIAVTFVDWSDMPRWKLINESLGMGQPEPPETYSTSEHLYTTMDIPAGVTGSLPRASRERLGIEAEELEDVGETGRARSQVPRRGQRDDRAPRKTRVRRRTRGGVAVSGGEPAKPETDSRPQHQPAGDGAAEHSQPARRRRRRSRRGGRKDTAAG